MSEPLEARLVRALRRYLAPELASRVAREVVQEPEPAPPAEAERDELLAIIHRDGGHYVGEHGITKAVADAHATWAAVVAERDAAIAERDRLRDALIDLRADTRELAVHERVCEVLGSDTHRDPGRARPAHTARSKRRHEAEDAWTATSYYRRAAFWRALRESLAERYAERGGESPAQMVVLREQWRDALHAERAVKEALRTKGRPSAALWIALPTSMQSLALRRIRHISTDVRRGVEREAAAIAATILESWLREEVGDE